MIGRCTLSPVASDQAPHLSRRHAEHGLPLESGSIADLQRAVDLQPGQFAVAHTDQSRITAVLTRTAG